MYSLLNRCNDDIKLPRNNVTINVRSTPTQPYGTFPVLTYPHEYESFFVKQLHGEGRYVHDGTTKHRRIETKLTFVILSEYGILYGTLLVTYVGQYSM